MPSETCTGSCQGSAQLCVDRQKHTPTPCPCRTCGAPCTPPPPAWAHGTAAAASPHVSLQQWHGQAGCGAAGRQGETPPHAGASHRSLASPACSLSAVTKLRQAAAQLSMLILQHRPSPATPPPHHTPPIPNPPFFFPSFFCCFLRMSFSATRSTCSLTRRPRSYVCR